MQGPDLQAKIDLVAGAGPIKAWSVIVTVLGDLCLDHEDRISGRLMNRLLGHLGVSAQAGRVAVHRLKRDGWVDTERQGRESGYRLSAAGRAETKLVWETVYSREAPEAGTALLVVGAPDIPPPAFAESLGKRAVILAPRTAVITAGRVPAQALAARLPRGSAPAWVADQVADAGLRIEYTTLIGRLAEIQPLGGAGDSVAAAALRLAVLHHWRRLCLRQGGLADVLLPPEWEGGRARAAVADALDALPRPDLAMLEDAARAADPEDPEVAAE